MTVREAGKLVWYLSFPRPGPFFSVGKSLFFMFGSVIGLVLGYHAPSPIRWLLMFVLFEFVVSHGKYFINDFAGRFSDYQFLRSERNLMARGGASYLFISGYASLRLALGVAGLLLFFSRISAALAMSIIALQLGYELVKVARGRWRGLATFLTVAATYSVRTAAGLAAVAPASLERLPGLASIVWATGLAALFLATYWHQSAKYYFETAKLEIETLRRYKPGIVWIYRPETFSSLTRCPLWWRLLLVVLCISSIGFLGLGQAAWPGTVVATLAILSWSGPGIYIGLVLKRRFIPEDWHAFMFAAIVVATAGYSLATQTTPFLALGLAATAVAVSLLSSGDRTRQLLLA